MPALSAMVKGAFYEADCLQAAWDLVKDWSWDERMQLYLDSHRDALAARIRRYSLLDLAKADKQPALGIADTPEKCEECGGLFEPLSRQATQISMGPWYIRDRNNPYRPGCSYEVLLKQIEAVLDNMVDSVFVAGQPKKWRGELLIETASSPSDGRWSPPSPRRTWSRPPPGAPPRCSATSPASPGWRAPAAR